MENQKTDWLDEYAQILEKAKTEHDFEEPRPSFDSTDVFAPWEKDKFGILLSSTTEFIK